MEVNTVEFVSSALEQLSSLSTKILEGKEKTVLNIQTDDYFFLGAVSSPLHQISTEDQSTRVPI